MPSSPHLIRLRLSFNPAERHHRKACRKSTSSAHKSKTALASPLVAISRYPVPSQCSLSDMTPSNSLRVIVTVVVASKPSSRCCRKRVMLKSGRKRLCYRESPVATFSPPLRGGRPHACQDSNLCDRLACNGSAMAGPSRPSARTPPRSSNAPVMYAFPPWRCFRQVSQLLECICLEMPRLLLRVGEHHLVHHFSGPAIISRFEVLPSPCDHCVHSTHVLNIFLRGFNTRQRIEIRWISVVPADVALIYSLRVLRQRAVVFAGRPFILQAWRHPQGLGKISCWAHRLVHHTHGLGHAHICSGRGNPSLSPAAVRLPHTAQSC